MVKRLNSLYDIQLLLKKFGIIIYVGDRLADMELMEIELKELYDLQLIDQKQWLQSTLLLRKEIQIEKNKREK